MIQPSLLLSLAARPALRRAALALVVATALAPIGSHAAIVGLYGPWTSFQSASGETGVVTRYDDGSRLSIATRGSDVVMTLENPAWRLTVGRRVPLTVAFAGGQTFADEAVVVGLHSIEIVVGDAAFFEGFAHAKRAEIQVLGETWATNLDGSRRATQDMLRLMAD